MKRTLLAGFMIVLFSSSMAFADAMDLPKGLQGVSLGGTYFLHYTAGHSENPAGSMDYNKFSISRGYLTLKKSFSDAFSSRITADTYTDANGNWAVRLKYVYGNYNFGDMSFLTQTHIEAGLVHTPWLDFEEHINRHRMQGTMFMERSGIFNSADVGFTVGGNLGGELDENYKKNVNKHYAGHWGSYQIGVYNGGGYHATEMNQNKVIQARLTLRPLPSGSLEGFQVSYFGIFGKGNISGGNSDLPNYTLTALMASYEGRVITLTGQYVMGEGNASGTWVDANGDATKYAGFSVFGDLRFTSNSDIIVRYDSWDPNTDVDKDAVTRIIAGLGHKFDSHNTLLADYQIETPEDSNVGTKSNAFKLTWQIDF